MATSMLVTVQCPSCRTRLRVQDSWTSVTCPRCNRVIRLGPVPRQREPSEEKVSPRPASSRNLVLIVVLGMVTLVAPVAGALFLSSRSRSQATPPQAAGSSASVAHTRGTAAAGAFDPQNLEATKQWAEREHYQLLAAHAASGANIYAWEHRLKTTLTAWQKAMAGQTIRWSFPVEYVGQDAVKVENGWRGEYRPDQPLDCEYLHILLLPPRELERDLGGTSREEWYQHRNSLLVGRQITEEHRRSLKRGDTITIEGRIKIVDRIAKAGILVMIENIRAIRGS